MPRIADDGKHKNTDCTRTRLEQDNGHILFVLFEEETALDYCHTHT